MKTGSKTRMKKALSLCLALALTLVLAAFPALGDGPAVIREGDWAAYENVVWDEMSGMGHSEWTLFEYNGLGGDVVIPSELDGRKIARISSDTL